MSQLTAKDRLHRLVGKVGAGKPNFVTTEGDEGFSSIVTMTVDGDEFTGDRVTDRNKRAAEQAAAEAFLHEHEEELVWNHALLEIIIRRRDYVTALKELVQKTVGDAPAMMPRYSTTKEGRDHKCTCSVRLRGQTRVAEVTASTEPEAKRQAAGEILRQVEVINVVDPPRAAQPTAACSKVGPRRVYTDRGERFGVEPPAVRQWGT